jgi:hypothetical protein
MIYLDLLADKLHLFSLLTGARMLKQDFPLKDSYITPDDPQSLRLLAFKGHGREFWGAGELSDIYLRRNHAMKFAKKEGLCGVGSYVFHLKEVLKAPRVISIFGDITYEKDISTKSIKKNLPLSDLKFNVPSIRDYVTPFDPASLTYERMSRRNHTD